MKKIIAFSSVLSFAPLFVFADTTIMNILATLIGFLNYIVPALITIAVIYFVWGVISFMTASDEETKKVGKDYKWTHRSFYYRSFLGYYCCCKEFFLFK
jgi:hypothetical protein